MIKRKKISVNQYTVPIMFIIICAVAIYYSGLSGGFLIDQVVKRFARNAFLVLALILPIMAGLGINFGMILGAMSGQVALIFVEDIIMFDATGVTGILISFIFATPISIVLGMFCGGVLNRSKGREMITSMMLGYFMMGVYQFFVLYLFGSVVPFDRKELILSRGYGVRNALNLKTAGGLDRFIDKIIGKSININGIQIPITTFAVIVLGCLFIVWFRNTKLGQDMRAVGQDMKVAQAAGINVDRTRLIAVVLSTVTASYGQIIYLQNIGNLNTYNGADQAALYAAAALLIGGASVSKATITNALTGTLLFHLMFIVMPVAGANITGNSMMGEYFRTFVSYGVVTVTLILHSIRRNNERNLEMQNLRLDIGGAKNK